eukprot:11802397-Prorocentrum_lima.AAC.1
MLRCGLIGVRFGDGHSHGMSWRRTCSRDTSVVVPHRSMPLPQGGASFGEWSSRRTVAHQGWTIYRMRCSTKALTSSVASWGRPSALQRAATVQASTEHWGRTRTC